MSIRLKVGISNIKADRVHFAQYYKQYLFHIHIAGISRLKAMTNN